MYLYKIVISVNIISKIKDFSSVIVTDPRGITIKKCLCGGETMRAIWLINGEWKVNSLGPK